jgi:hypothetical protein
MRNSEGFPRFSMHVVFIEGVYAKFCIADVAVFGASEQFVETACGNQHNQPATPQIN